MSDDKPSNRATLLVIFMLSITLVVGEVIGEVVATAADKADAKAEAVREGHAHYEAAPNGKPDFKWNPKCGDKK